MVLTSSSVKCEVNGAMTLRVRRGKSSSTVWEPLSVMVISTPRASPGSGDRVRNPFASIRSRRDDSVCGLCVRAVRRSSSLGRSGPSVETKARTSHSLAVSSESLSRNTFSVSPMIPVAPRSRFRNATRSIWFSRLWLRASVFRGG